jgi:hypothetical protein
MRTVSRLRLLCFLLFTSLLMCCRLYYLTLSKPSHPHHSTLATNISLHDQLCLLPKLVRLICYGGGGENRTPVQNAFALKGLQQLPIVAEITLYNLSINHFTS